MTSDISFLEQVRDILDQESKITHRLNIKNCLDKIDRFLFVEHMINSELESWKPYCYEEDKCKTYTEEDKIQPGHGPCCTCQVCGYLHDECICQYLEEPCLSCPYKGPLHVKPP